MQTIRQWLEQLGFPQYAEAFERNAVDLNIAKELTQQDLRDLGVEALGHRKLLLHAIADLNGAQAPAATPQAVQDQLPSQRSLSAAAERRQLTVLFCDLVGSTELAQRLDPEALRELMQAFRRTCTEVINRYGGHVAQYLGDGLMVYFGWPQAHEDDAERSLRTALEIVQTLEGVQVAQPLSVRIGIATGAVVVGPGGDGEHGEAKLAVGETPNLAARMQGLASANQVVIAPSTRLLIGTTFELADLGEHVLKGIVEPIHAWGVLGLGKGESRFETSHSEVGLTPLVGREEELALLLKRWQQAEEGEGQVVLVGAEPGIGKSRLTRVLRERLDEARYPVLHCQCSPYHLNSALYPNIQQLERAAGFAREDSAEQKLDKMQAVLLGSEAQVSESAPLFAALLSLPVDRYPPLNLSPQKQKEKTLEALAGQVEALAQRQPMLMVWEDVHWIDATSQEYLDMLVPRLRNLPVLLIVTYRPEYSARWTDQAHVTPLGLNRLGRRQGTELVAQLTGGKALPQEVLDQILGHTDGVPLFIEELTKSVLESRLLDEKSDSYVLRAPLPALAIPTTLRESLLARLDRLAPVREIAQIGACIGREFSYELVNAVSPLHGERLDEALEQLSRTGLLFRRGAPPDATYTFKHALVQDVAYDSMLKSKRSLLHAQIGTLLENDFSDTVANDPELLAHHFKQAGLNQRALPYWVQAGQRASTKTALAEAVSHLSNALESVQTLSASTERDRSELQVRVKLARAQLACLGWASAELPKTLVPAQELAERLGDNQFLFETLNYLQMYYLSVPTVEMAREYAQRLLALAAVTGDARMIGRGHLACAMSECLAGNWREAKEHGERALQLCDVERDAARMCGLLAWAPHWYWALGMPEQAAAASLRGLEIAKRTARPFEVIWALTGGSSGLIHTGDTKRALAWNREAREFAREHAMRFAETTPCNLWGGAALIADGQYFEGYEMATLGGVNWEATGGFTQTPYLHTCRAHALGMLGRVEEGIELARRTLKFTRDSEHRTWEPMTLVVLGNLLCQAHKPADARLEEACDAFEEALRVCRSKSAKGFELIAATALARLWQSQGKRREPYELLAPIYHWFTEGLDTRDLRNAKALLDELAGVPSAITPLNDLTMDSNGSIASLDDRS